MDKLIMHELCENQKCPYCDEILVLKKNEYRTEANFSFWKCKKCYVELVEVVKVNEVKNGYS